jgi:hypothetical protein
MEGNGCPVKVQVPVPYPWRLSVGLSYTYTLTQSTQESNFFFTLFAVSFRCIGTHGGYRYSGIRGRGVWYKVTHFFYLSSGNRLFVENSFLT